LCRSLVSSEHGLDSMRQLRLGQLSAVDGNLCVPKLPRGFLLRVLGTLNLCPLCRGAVLKLECNERMRGLRLGAVRCFFGLIKLYLMPSWLLPSEHWKHHMIALFRGDFLVGVGSCACIHL